MWSSTPLGEYVRALAAQQVLHSADLELEATIDNAGARVYCVLSVVFTLPSLPRPPSVRCSPTGPSPAPLHCVAQRKRSPPSRAERATSRPPSLRRTSHGYDGRLPPGPAAAYSGPP